MTDLGEETMAETVREELVTYLRAGTINEGRVAKTLDITDLEIGNLDRLKRIHFCLSDQVREFVERLGDELRRIDTTTQRERVVTRGEVRGQIDWQETTNLRYSAAGGDRTQFACETPYTEYNTARNLVLKKLLWVIHSTATQDLKEISYPWRTSKWTDDDITDFNRLYNRNVHLNRISGGESITVTDRMLSETRSARQTLYKDAYKLYDLYDRLLSNTRDDDVGELLQDTLVIPERIPRLFELYCVFQLLRQLQLHGLELQVIEPGATYLGKLETEERRVKVFHDATGSLSFFVPLEDIEQPVTDYYKRHRRSLQRHQALVDSFLDVESRPSLYSGRPDLVLEVYDVADGEETLTDVVLGEIKYTSSQQTFSTGLRELIEYMEFAQIDTSSRTYISDEGINISGLILTEDVETQHHELAEPIRHLTANTLQSGATESDWLPDTLTELQMVDPSSA
jgi:hypothetical protein